MVGGRAYRLMRDAEGFWVFTISKKLGLLIACSVLGVVVLAMALLVSERRLILEDHQSGVRQLVEAAHGVLHTYHGRASRGGMSEEEAKQRALEVLKGMRYGGNGYFWINDMHPRMVMHPFNPGLDGKDLSEVADPTGKRLFVEAVEVVKGRGGGFVPYFWAKPGSEKPVEKVSYVKGFAPWGWVVGSGVYVDSVDATVGRRMEYVCLGAAGVAVLLCGIGWLVGRSVTRPMREAVRIAQRVAAGDLTSRARAWSADESGQLLRALGEMNEGLERVVRDVRRGTLTVAGESSRIAMGNRELSERAKRQMDFFKRTTDSMAMMAGAVQRMASSAGHANALAISTSEIAQKGGRSVGEVVQTMEGLSESATKIVDISRVIHDIAFQTHLLALNAAVEAARVGESGMGFAVVASEVRALAQRSAAAAKEIRQLIEESVGRVRIGKAQAHEAGETMGEIVCSARTVMEMLGEITLASQEQAAEIGQIHGAVGEMNRATQSNLELVEKAAEATQTMHAEAEGLERLVRTFELPEVRDPR